VLHRAAGSVSSFGGSPHDLHIGLGDCTRITALQIRWPRTSELQTLTQVPLDSWLAVLEGDAPFRQQQRKPFHFLRFTAAGGRTKPLTGWVSSRSPVQGSSRVLVLALLALRSPTLGAMQSASRPEPERQAREQAGHARMLRVLAQFAEEDYHTNPSFGTD